tara:strand:+ start:516 stop:719 length:204 start_codon:yes stop_codon:yes gene_type:complete
LYSSPKKEQNKYEGLNGPTQIDDRFVWHQMIHTLIQELNTTEEKVYDMNYVASLNWLAFFKNKNEIK